MKFSVENESRKTICRVHVDGCLVEDTDTKRCDYFFKICETERYVLVELKGSNVKDAFPQIIATLNYLKDKLNITAEQCEAHIVSTRVPKQAVEGVTKLRKRMLRDHKLSVKVQNRRASITV